MVGCLEISKHPICCYWASYFQSIYYYERLILRVKRNLPNAILETMMKIETI